MHTHIYNIIIFAFAAAIYTLRRDDDTAENSWISRSPESANHPLLISPRPAVVLLSSLIDDPDQPLNSSSFPFPSSVAVLLLPGRPPVKQVTIDMIG